MTKKNENDFVPDEAEIDENLENIEAEADTNAVEQSVDERDNEISELNCELAETREKVTRLTAMLQQLQADFDNYRKRNATLATESRQKGVFDAIKAILPAFDAVESAQKQITDASTLEGLDMVERKLLDSLATLEITKINSVGEQFDPNLHNVVVAEACEGVPSGQIIEEFGAGYTSPSGVVRFATVKIAK